MGILKGPVLHLTMFLRTPLLILSYNLVPLFHYQIILYGLNPFDAAGNFTRVIDGILRINKTAQLNRALEGFDTDLE